MGRAAAGQRLEKMIQRFCVFAENGFEDVLLKMAVVYSDGTATDFEAVEYLQIQFKRLVNTKLWRILRPGIAIRKKFAAS